MSVLLPVLTHVLTLTMEEQGRLMSRYSNGYIATQILGGMLADKIGPKSVVTLGIAGSCVCCAVAPVVAIWFGSNAFGFVFLAMGIIQGLLFPAGSVVLAQWLLPSERSWASSISAIGTAAGALFMNAFGPVLASRFSWPAVFYFNALICLALLVAWIRYGASSPLESIASEEEISMLKDAQVITSSSRAKPIFPPVTLFMRLPVAVLLLCHFAQNWQMAFADWLPLFFTSKLGMDPEIVGLHLAIIASVELPARAVTKSVPDTMLGRGWSLLRCRQAMSLLGFGFHTVLSLVVVGLMLFISVEIPWTVIVTFSCVFAVSKGTMCLHAGGYFANYLDLTQEYSGALAGFGNTFATVAGLTFPKVASWALERTSANWVPLVCSVVLMNLLAMIGIIAGMSVDSLDKAQVSKHVPKKSRKESAKSSDSEEDDQTPKECPAKTMLKGGCRSIAMQLKAGKLEMPVAMCSSDISSWMARCYPFSLLF
jgi:MFS family permease